MLLTQKASNCSSYSSSYGYTLLLTGFFPAEMVFTERAIPILVEAGIEWVIVANNHISRACKVRNASLFRLLTLHFLRTIHIPHMETITVLQTLLIK